MIRKIRKALISRVSLFLYFFFLLILQGCESLALLTTPVKIAIPSKTEAAAKAEAFFWQILHAGKYQEIPTAQRFLLIAYLQNPNDPKLAAHLGFLHLWRITERDFKNPDPLITNEAILANKYFSDSHILDPNNAIYEGFWGDAQLVESQIFKDKRQEIRGYFTLKRAIEKWPEFNYFTAGYPMSSLPANSKQFKEGLDWQWNTLDLCAETNINRKHPTFDSFMKLETQKGKKRACWNSWIAPYNFEGFFLNMGDMLVKSGDWPTAIIIYNNAKLAKNYSTWPFKEMLEKRIANAQRNVTNFQQSHINPDQTILFNSGHGCMACHQQQ